MIVRAAAHIVSLVFHPIFIASYMLLMLMWVNPFIFGGQHVSDSIHLLILIIPTSVVIPIICIALMKPLGFVESFQLKTRQERIVPYLSTAILYLWLFINIYNQKQFPLPYTIFFLGGLIAIFITFFINIFSKISAHCVGVGGLFGMALLTRIYFSYPSVSLNIFENTVLEFSTDYIIIGTIVIAGIVGTSRLVLNAHERSDIYGGYIVGFASQLIAFQILNNYGS